ncbi:MAG: hypothetical protein ACLP2Y_03880 [Limisphaerales bacterium]
MFDDVRMQQDESDKNNAGNQAQTTSLSNTDSVGDYERNFKQESRRNKKFRFRKSNKHRRAEKWISPCSV